MRWALLAVLVVVTGCRGKAKQCEDFIQHANEAEGTLRNADDKASRAQEPCKAFVAAGKPCNPQDIRAAFVALHEAADKTEFEVKKIEAVDTKDEKLATIKTAYTAQMKELGSAYRDAARLLDEKRTTPATEAELNSIDARTDGTTAKMNALTDEINTYCGAK